MRISSFGTGGTGPMWRAGYLALLVFYFVSVPVQGARIGDLSESTVGEQIQRFLSFQDPSVRYAVAGSILLGICCGLLGSFIVVRKMALVGDALSHAVLPGVAFGFMWTIFRDPMAPKDPLVIFIGATIAGLLGTTVVSFIKQTTRLKEDAALGMVLAGFFSVGICLVTMIQDLPTGNKSGIDKFLFGQAAALGADDVKLMTVVTILSCGIIALFYKEFLVTSFDSGFARSVGFPVQLFHHGLMLLLAFAVVTALQAVGVVLVSAMLITPAAAAYLLTDRMHRMIWIAAGFGVLAGVSGAFFSFLGPSLPTGPLMVLSASGIFGVAYFFAPRYGVLVKWWRHRSRVRRVLRENTLKAVYHVLEEARFARESVSTEELAVRRRQDMAAASKDVEELIRHGYLTQAGDQLSFTPPGWQIACSIVRNHRLWELYLTHEANIQADHVHEDAEQIEHVLGESMVRQLEKRLNFATLDPHGKPIPGQADIEKGASPTKDESELHGFGKQLRRG